MMNKKGGALAIAFWYILGLFTGLFLAMAFR